MRLGLHTLGIGVGARRDVIDAVAVAAEAAGFATLWAGEHLVMVDDPASHYPYASDGRIAIPATADWLDPLVCLAFAAAATSTIGLATGVLLLAEHQPIAVAKAAASLDVLSGGRLRLGVGIGWSAEEFAALGIPFAGRETRTEEYVAVLRTLWHENVASFAGEFVRFSAIRVRPAPFGERSIPIIVGGNSKAALRRVADWGDGWYGFNLDGPADVARRLAYLEEQCLRAGRDSNRLYRAVALRHPVLQDAAALADLGIDELVLVQTPPERPTDAPARMSELAETYRLS